MTTKTATILTRIEPGVKTAADTLFERIGTTTSGAINIFLHKAIEEGGFPFEVRTKSPRIPNLDTMTKDQIETMLTQSEDAIAAGKHRPATEVITELNHKYKVS